MAAPKAQCREKSIAIVSRRECVYKRAGEQSVTFHERGGTTERVTDFSFAKKNRNGAKSVPTMVRPIGIEPTQNPASEAGALSAELQAHAV